MSHDFESAAWADRHGDVSTGIDHLIEAIAGTFKLLVAIEYDAPWERDHCCG